MQVICLMRDFALDDSERFDKITSIRTKLMEGLSLSSTDLIGLVTFDKTRNILHYGFLINSEFKETLLSELDLIKCYATIPDLNWDVYVGKTTEIPSIYAAIEIVQDIHSTIELFDNNGSCKILVA